ncbi:uncharacterized protein TRIVIDRAFT_65020 [Trichoderma virens Gv29-8]|uniref:Uncharacterized protein n=1 Tax=Hypocrea virens (strain Gv29-8 / FGSC 10586) TaxID=413071 RepID=G9NBG1_HYPVG|nr:uncharacterized protein TRIVIDRAFT_65020 [Trichoderma virens Gv29-8]EHK16166.1 hypothetical protein TRIVIDRAFT_65020 [Trichoderma virens Gv29-8]
MSHGIDHFRNSPITPRLWIWTCRKCKRKYPLSCTRKCLSCSHMVYFARRGSPEAKHFKLRPAHAYKCRGQWLHKIKERPGEHHDISKPTADTSSPAAKQEGKGPEKRGKDSEQKEKESKEEKKESEEEKKKSEEEKREAEEKQKQKRRERAYNNWLSRTKHYKFQKKPSRLNQVWVPQMDSETDGGKNNGH